MVSFSFLFYASYDRVGEREREIVGVGFDPFIWKAREIEGGRSCVRHASETFEDGRGSRKGDLDPDRAWSRVKFK